MYRFYYISFSLVAGAQGAPNRRVFAVFVLWDAVARLISKWHSPLATLAASPIALVYKMDLPATNKTVLSPTMYLSLSTNMSIQFTDHVNEFRRLRAEFWNTPSVHEELKAYEARDNDYEYKIL